MTYTSEKVRCTAEGHRMRAEAYSVLVNSDGSQWCTVCLADFLNAGKLVLVAPGTIGLGHVVPPNPDGTIPVPFTTTDDGNAILDGDTEFSWGSEASDG